MQDENEDLSSKNEGARVLDVQSESETHSVMSDSLQSHELYLQARILEWVAVPFSRGSS